MYLRHSTRIKDGKTHTYWRLVRSVRCGSKVQQKTIAHLGELDEQGRAQARMLARQMTGRGEQVELFEEQASGAVVPVHIDRTYPVSAYRAALDRLSNGEQLGKIVLTHG